jgi:hypothetical protein
MRHLLVTAVAAAGCLAGGAAASAPRDLLQSYYLSPTGRAAPLRAGASYGASLFPIGIRVRVKGGGWSGVQWKSGSVYFHGGGPPNYGWVHLLRGPAAGIPQGLVSIMTAYGKTPAVAATVHVLRTRGRGAAYGEAVPVTLAGFPGIRFDGRVTGRKNFDHVGHVFVPFSPPSGAARYYPDEYPVYGDVFRVIVLDVRGRAVVIYVENAGLPASRFSAFLAKGETILRTVRFPG